ncbi:MAG: S8 family serine peptidase [Bacteroidota bacterium]
MYKKIGLNIILILLLSVAAKGQSKYWIYFSDKGPSNQVQKLLSPEAYTNRAMLGLSVYQQSDEPVYSGYVDSLTHYGARIVNHSKWLNAVSAFIDRKKLGQISSLGFVEEVSPISTQIQVLSIQNGKSQDTSYAATLKQVNAKSFHQAGLNGAGVSIGIIDGGFLEANEEEDLVAIFSEKRLMGAKDFIEPPLDGPFDGSKSLGDNHGTEVWRMIAGKKGHKYYGLASEANFYLARTDQGDREYRGEEDNWIAALEWMDSLGVRIINSSLGYSVGYDDPDENYDQSSVDGSTSAITRAAQIAATEKGILIILSAGNDGANSFQFVSLPADAKDVLSIGAVGLNHGIKMGYSSIGPERLNYIKPDVSCFARNGTSFAAPVITGLAACMMQKNPLLSNNQIIDVIEKSAHLYPYGNNYIGYGVPDCSKILANMNQATLPNNSARLIHVQQKSYKIERYKNIRSLVVFHKKDEKNVIVQKFSRPEAKFVTIEKIEGSVRTTVVIDKQVLEIIWE